MECKECQCRIWHGLFGVAAIKTFGWQYQPILTLKKPTMDCEKQNVLKIRLKWKEAYENQQFAVVFATEDKTNNTTSDQIDNETDTIQIGQEELNANCLNIRQRLLRPRTVL